MYDLEDLLKIFRKKYSHIISSAILVGSAVYLERLRSGGDIDLVVVMKDINEWKNACCAFCTEDADQVITNSMELFNQGKIQYFCLKFEIEGIPFSVDFILENILDCFTNNFDYYLNQKIYKVSPTKQNTYFLLGREPNTIRVEKENLPYKNLYRIYLPYGVIINNHFYLDESK